MLYRYLPCRNFTTPELAGIVADGHGSSEEGPSPRPGILENTSFLEGRMATRARSGSEAGLADGAEQAVRGSWGADATRELTLQI